LFIAVQLLELLWALSFSSGTKKCQSLWESFVEVRLTREEEEKRVKGIEPSCAAWEAAVLPLNYTREEIFDFRFCDYRLQPKQIANRFSTPNAVACAVLSAFNFHG
jgi:hypothetical protein